MIESNWRLRVCLAVLIFAAAMYRYWPMPAAIGPCGTGYESLELACSLVHKGAFADPFTPLPTGPSAHVAPLFPALVAGLMKWFGDGPAASNAVQWLAALTIALQLSLWPWAARRLGMGFVSGAIGAAGWLAVGFILLPMWESPQVGLLVLLLAVCVHRILREKVSTGFVILTGALWGVTLLFNPAPLITGAALTVWALSIPRIPRMQKLALIAVLLAIVSPWLVRNYQVFHHPIFVRDNLGTELWSSNNPCATFSFRENRTANCFRHPNESASEAAQVRAMGEYEYNREKLREALAWMKNNRAKFADLTKQRFLAFWFYTPGGNYFAGRHIPPSIWIIWLAFPLSVAGLWLLFRRDRASAWICLAWLALFPPIYYFVEFIPRYRYPILWATFLPASFALQQAAEAAWRRFRKPAPRVLPAPNPQQS